MTIDLSPPGEGPTAQAREVGRRFALLAKNQVYRLTGDDTGPTFASQEIVGATIRIHFTHASGLLARNRPVQSLEVAGADRKFYPAVGRIERETLVVSAPAVKEPQALRYAWTNAPEANLYNGAGLPAVPFRSDDW